LALTNVGPQARKARVGETERAEGSFWIWPIMCAEAEWRDAQKAMDA
jgi:hypothetical protein